MDFKAYEQSVARTSGGWSTQKERTILCALGLSGESGEVIELVKKHYYHDHPLPKDKLKEELGDALFYLVEMGAAHGITFEEIAVYNVEKLKDRYPNGWDPQRSIHRAK